MPQRYTHIVSCFVIITSPYRSRCSAIHDTRIGSRTYESWLPCCRQLNALSTNVHIDWNFKANIDIVNYGSVFGKDTIDVFSSYDVFASKVCQLDDDDDFGHFVNFSNENTNKECSTTTSRSTEGGGVFMPPLQV